MSALPVAPTLSDLVLDYFRDHDWTTGRRVAYQLALCHQVAQGSVANEIRRLAQRRRLQCRRSVASRGVLEYRLPGPPPEAQVAEAVSPFQRLCDVLVAHPEHTWTVEELVAHVGSTWAVVAACVERLVQERVLVREKRRWRTADVPAGSPRWWWAPGERAPLDVRRRQRRRP